MRGHKCIFILEGPEGNAELWEGEFGYQLYFECVFHDELELGYKPTYSRRPEFYSYYKFDESAINDAFEDAKIAVGLEDWKTTLEDFKD